MTPKADTSDEEVRPIAIHVQQIVYDVDLKHLHRKRISVIDLEFSKEQLKDMIENFQKALESKSNRGSIRVRYKGPMVLE